MNQWEPVSSSAHTSQMKDEAIMRIAKALDEADRVSQVYRAALIVACSEIERLKARDQEPR